MFKEIQLTDIPEFERLQKLYEEVCDLAGQPVQLSMFKDEPELERTTATASTDLGYPEILFRQDAVSCLNACHELLHLRCAYQGYPMAEVTYNAEEEDTQKGWEWYDAVVAINSMNEHRIIYPAMEQMGFDPTTAGEDMVRKNFFSGLEETRKAVQMGAMSQSDLFYLVVEVARIALEVKDKEIIDKLFAEKAWFPSHYAMGRKVARLLRKSGTSPVAMKKAIENALKIAGVPRNRYTLAADRVKLMQDDG